MNLIAFNHHRRSLLAMNHLGEFFIFQSNTLFSYFINLQVKESPVKHSLPSTGMAARALYDLNEAVELDDRHEQIDALLDDALENDADDRSRSPAMPLQPPPVVQNTYGQVSTFASSKNSWNCLCVHWNSIALLAPPKFHISCC